MDALQLFLLRHEAPLHSTTAPLSIDSLFSTLSDAQLRHRPRPDLNAIAWIVWHMARAEDFGVQRFVAHRPQLFDSGGWMARLNVPLRHCGTGMTDDEVSDLSARVDLSALRAYWAAVGRGTREVVHALRPEALDEGIEPAYVHQVLFDEGVAGPNAAFMEQAYHGRTKAWFLVHLGLTHNYEHSAEAFVISGLLGFRRR
jgi:hypothetical protein